MARSEIWKSQSPFVPNQNIVIANVSFENVEMFKYLGVKATNTNDIFEEIKRRVNKETHVITHSLEKILSSRFFFFSNQLEVNTYKTITSPVILYGCETWCFALMGSIS